MYIKHSSILIALVFMISLLPLNANGSDLASYYTFKVYDIDTNQPINGATITVTYKGNNWQLEEANKWKNKTVSGTTSTNGTAEIYCFDFGHGGLFDISNSYFGPYAEAGLLLYSVTCQASGYNSIDLVENKFNVSNRQIRAGGARGIGITFFLKNPKSSGSSDIKSASISKDSGKTKKSSEVKCYVKYGKNKGSGNNWTIAYYIDNQSNANVVLTSVWHSGLNNAGIVYEGPVKLSTGRANYTASPGTMTEICQFGVSNLSYYTKIPVWFSTNIGQIKAEVIPFN